MVQLKTETKHHFQHPLLSAYPEVWRSVEGDLRCKQFQDDQPVFSHGDAAGTLWLVERGWVKLTRQTPDGKETVVGLCAEGDVFGEAALFANANYPYTAEAIGNDITLIAIPAATVRTVIAGNAPLSARIMAMLNERVSQAQLKFEHMSTMSAPQRLGCFLLRLSHSQTMGKNVLTIPVEKNVLAAYLGMKPETFSRSQKQLKEIGIHVAGHQITIERMEHLRDFVCGSCSKSGSCDVEDAAGGCHH